MRVFSGTYSPYDAALNTIVNNKFAQINQGCNQEVELEASIMRSCTSGSSCSVCEQMDGSAEKAACYARTCDCFGA